MDLQMHVHLYPVWDYDSYMRELVSIIWGNWYQSHEGNWYQSHEGTGSLTHALR